jgi:hypothetical protein
MFALAYMGRKRWAKPFQSPYFICNRGIRSKSIRKTSYPAHVRWGEHGAPVQGVSFLQEVLGKIDNYSVH